MKKPKVNVEGIEYLVLENLGFSHTLGYYGKVIDYNGTERIVASYNRKYWKLHVPKVIVDRLAN